MFGKLKELLTGAGPAADDAGDLRLAVAALLIEAGTMDERFEDKERSMILALLKQRFQIDGSELDELMAAAQKRSEASEQYYPLTDLICKRMSGPERVEVIEMLWSVAYADGELDAYEDSLIRQVAALLQVSDRDRAYARQRAIAASSKTAEG